MRPTQRNPWAIAASLLLAVFLWGGNNTGIKVLVHSWPPLWVGGTRFVCAGLLMLALLRWTRWLGPQSVCSEELKRQLWWQGGLSLAVYIAFFNWALHFTAASHVALYLGASPVWAFLWEGRAGQERGELFKRTAAALLALLGVVTLFWPALHSQSGTWPGELLALCGSVLWVVYGRQCRKLSHALSGAEISAHTMFRAGALLLPLGLVEIAGSGLPAWDSRLLLIQLYCIAVGGVIAFCLWNNALRHWKTSEVYLFNNLIPASTMLWAHFCLGEPMTPTFWLAMVLIAGGVTIGQTHWRKLLGNFWLPTE